MYINVNGQNCVYILVILLAVFPSRISKLSIFPANKEVLPLTQAPKYKHQPMICS